MSHAPTVKLPEEVIEKAYEISKEEGITVEVFISRAVEEKAAAWKRIKSLKERANRSNHEKFFQALSKIPDAEPENFDKFQ